MITCEFCDDISHCRDCSLGNPCLGCEDYDAEDDACYSDGGCGREDERRRD